MTEETNENQELQDIIIPKIEIERKPKEKKPYYYSEGVKMVECSGCRNSVLYSQIGKLNGYLYCQSCYLVRIEERIKDWKSAYKHFKNGKESFSRNDINSKECPRLSDYIN